MAAIAIARVSFERPSDWNELTGPDFDERAEAMLPVIEEALRTLKVLFENANPGWNVRVED